MLCIAHRIQWYSNGQKLSDRQMVWYKDTKKWRSPEVILMHYLPTGVYSEYTVIHNHHYSCVYLLGITRPTTTRERIENRLYVPYEYWAELSPEKIVRCSDHHLNTRQIRVQMHYSDPHS